MGKVVNKFNKLKMDYHTICKHRRHLDEKMEPSMQKKKKTNTKNTQKQIAKNKNKNQYFENNNTQQQHL